MRFRAVRQNYRFSPVVHRCGINLIHYYDAETLYFTNVTYVRSCINRFFLKQSNLKQSTKVVFFSDKKGCSISWWNQWFSTEAPETNKDNRHVTYDKVIQLMMASLLGSCNHKLQKWNLILTLIEDNAKVLRSRSHSQMCSISQIQLHQSLSFNHLFKYIVVVYIPTGP